MRQLLAVSFGLLFMIAGLRAVQAQTHVSGTVVDSSSGDPVAHATVRAAGTYAGTAASDEGRFALSVPAGVQRLRIGAVGYATVVRWIATGQDSVRMTVHLPPQNVPLGHVTVTADRRAIEQNPSRYTIRPASVKQTPGLGEPDVLRAAASLPGISQPNDIDARLNVRGGSSDQNQFLLDGIEIYNPTHLFGLYGAFNPYATGETTVHAASFPARHGGRLSSVIDVGTRVPSDSAYTRANLSLTSLSGAHAQEWGDTGVVLGVRRTYLDPVLAAMSSSSDGSMGYSFLDVNAKVRHSLSENVTVTGLGFFQRDHLSGSGGEGTFEGNSDASENRQESVITWGNALGALRLQAQQGALRHELTGSFVRSVTDAGLSSFTLDNILHDWTARYDGVLSGDRTRLRLGGQWKQQIFDYGWSTDSRETLANVLYGGLGVEEPSSGLPSTWRTRQARPLLSGYTSVERHLWGDRVTLRGGLRIDGVWQDEAVFQPRVRATVQATSALRIHASTGRYAQFAATGYEGQEFNVAEPLLPLDRPTTAWTTTAGVSADLGPRYQVRATTYARTMDRFPRLREATPSASEGLPFRYGTATAYGLDLMAEKSRGWITGQLSYSFGYVRTELSDERFPPSWSLPHSLRAMLGLQLGQWTLHTSGLVRSGLPYTPSRGRIRDLDPRGNDIQGDRHLLGARNSERVPPYARVDLALRRTYQAQWFDWTLYVQALNLLNRRNILRINPRELYAHGLQNTSGQQQGAQRSLPIIPTVGVEFSF
jgi:hypothetical protein